MKHTNLRPKPGFRIIKSSGEIENFSEKKLRNSLRRSGLKEKDCQRISKTVSNTVLDGTTSKDIFRKTMRLVKQQSAVAAAHYSLKRALLNLGPTGYEFEHFVGKYFENQGFQTSVGVILQGGIVRHEVDVVASKPNYNIYTECKFHNNGGKKNDIKVALYVKARWDDLKNGPDGKYLRGYALATNTVFTKDAITYAEGVGLMLLGVNAPAGETFLDMIKKHKLYPITALVRLKKAYCKELLKRKIILCSELLNEDKLMLKIGMKPDEVSTVIKDIHTLLGL